MNLKLILIKILSMLMSILIITVSQVLRYSKRNMHFYFGREIMQNITFIF